MAESGHFSVGPFCGGCRFSPVEHTGCTTDPRRFRIKKGEKVPKYSSTQVRGLQALFNAIRLWRKPHQAYRGR